MAARPYNADYRGWRGFIDFSTGGTLGDWLIHCLGPAHLALRLDLAAPISVEAVNVVEKNDFRWPLSDEVIYEFPARGNMPPVTIHAYQAMRGAFKNPPGMAEGDRAAAADEQPGHRQEPPVRAGRRRHDAGRRPA